MLKAKHTNILLVGFFPANPGTLRQAETNKPLKWPKRQRDPKIELYWQ
jgi:hypothetical protein